MIFTVVAAGGALIFSACGEDDDGTEVSTAGDFPTTVENSLGNSTGTTLFVPLGGGQVGAYGTRSMTHVQIEATVAATLWQRQGHRTGHSRAARCCKYLASTPHSCLSSSTSRVRLGDLDE